MERQTSVVVASGRFQTVHKGSVAYLESAKRLAQRNGCSFFILTGPLDCELLLHGRRDNEPLARRMMLFEERKLLISLMLSISPARILNNAGSPHQGEPGLSAWTNAFFEPLLAMHAVSVEELNGRRNARIELATVIKDSDVTIYRPGDAKVHYTHYLKKKFPGVAIVNLGGEIDSELRGLSSSQLRSPGVSDRFQLPPTMLAAEVLMDHGQQLVAPSVAAKLESIFERFGNAPQSVESVMSALAG